jgi:hypothetical protein
LNEFFENVELRFNNIKEVIKIIFFDMVLGFFILMFLIFFICAIVLIPLALVNLFGIYGLPAVIIAFAILFIFFLVF